MLGRFLARHSARGSPYSASPSRLDVLMPAAVCSNFVSRRPSFKARAHRFGLTFLLVCWTLSTATQGQTIDEAEQAEMNERAEQARANPAVDAIMTRFPGARIIDVKLRQPEAAVPVEEEIGAVDETAPVDPPDETGLDDFFD